VIKGMATALKALMLVTLPSAWAWIENHRRSNTYIFTESLNIIGRTLFINYIITSQYP
jgi:hypothetical protein